MLFNAHISPIKYVYLTDEKFSLKYCYLKSKSHSLVVVLVIILLLSYLANTLLPYCIPKYTNPNRFIWVPELSATGKRTKGKERQDYFFPAPSLFSTALTRLHGTIFFLPLLGSSLLTKTFLINSLIHPTFAVPSLKSLEPSKLDTIYF